LTRDFVLISGDVVTDVAFQQIADVHRLHASTVTALLRAKPPRDPAVAKKAKELDGADFVGLDDKRQRLIHLENSADCDQGVITVSSSLLRLHPYLQVHTDLSDAHVYIFANWVLSILELKPHFVSAKFELLPYLVRKQFLSHANLNIPAEHITAPQRHFIPGIPSEKRSPASTAGGLRCCCYVMEHDAGYCLRVSSLPAYMQINLDVSRGVAGYFEKLAETAETAKEGNFVLKSFSGDCSRAEGVEVGARSSIKKTSVGAHCRIGAGVKLTNCVLMDHVTVADKVTMSNCVICSDAEVGEAASLKDTQVGSGATIEASSTVKGEAITAGDRNGSDSD